MNVVPDKAPTLPAAGQVLPVMIGLEVAVRLVVAVSVVPGWKFTVITIFSLVFDGEFTTSVKVTWNISYYS